MSFDSHLYNLLHRGNSGDVGFYLAACDGVGTVLELGCGSGRITLQLVRGGRGVTGLDSHPGMLKSLEKAACELQDDERKRLSIVQADMADFNIKEQFDRVIIPFSGLNCLLSDEALIACFLSARRHLRPEGELIFDVYHVPFDENDLQEDKEEGNEDDYDHLTTVFENDRTLHIFERTVPHKDPKRFDTSYLYREGDPANPKRDVTYTIKQRCLLEDEIPCLLEKAGCSLISITSDFKEEPITDQTSQLVVKARVATT